MPDDPIRKAAEACWASLRIVGDDKGVEERIAVIGAHMRKLEQETISTAGKANTEFWKDRIREVKEAVDRQWELFDAE